MKEIKAIVQRFMADKVIDSLRNVAHLPGITVSQVNGFGRSDTVGDRVQDGPMTKIEIVVPDKLAEPVVKVIADAAHTGRSGDGKIFVYEVEDVVKIRTGERGETAI